MFGLLFTVSKVPIRKATKKVYFQYNRSLSTTTNEGRLAVIGSGPAAIYAIKYLLKIWPTPLKIDVYDKSTLPYGLLRYGVAPDHPEMRAPAHEFDKFCPLKSINSNVNFIGGVMLRGDSFVDDSSRAQMTNNITEQKVINLQELCRNYSSVLISIGAAECVRLGIENSHLRGIISAGDFVRWYNGFARNDETTNAGIDAEYKSFLNTETKDEINKLVRRLTFLDQDGISIERFKQVRKNNHLIIVGHGNVALDVARCTTRAMDSFDTTLNVKHLLEELNVQTIDIVGRRGLLDASFSPSELRELLGIDEVLAVVDPEELQREKKKLLLIKQQPADRRVKKLLSLYEIMCSQWKDVQLKKNKKLIQIRGHMKPVKYDHPPHVSDWIGSVVFEKNGTSRQQIDTSLVIESLGFCQPAFISDLGLTSDKKAIHSQNYRIEWKGNPNYPIYTAGWSRTGSIGTIATAIMEGMAVSQIMRDDFVSGKW